MNFLNLNSPQWERWEILSLFFVDFDKRNEEKEKVKKKEQRLEINSKVKIAR